MLRTVVGGLWGSEAKGLAVETLTEDDRVDVAVRTGALNAGHTVYYKGKPYAMQMLPCAWINPGVQLVLGAGTYINVEQLEREIKWIEDAGLTVRDRLFIDSNAGAHVDSHKDGEKGLHESMGSTGKGCSEALIDRIKRRGAPLFRDLPEAKDYNLRDTVTLLNDWYDNGEQILLEGTQGTLLDFYLGDYPYVTARQTHAAAWLAEAGLSPKLDNEVILVLRTYPIRVAGNSGPMPGEISWPELARRQTRAGNEVIKEEDLKDFELKEAEVQRRLNMPIKSPHLYTPEEAQEHSANLVELHKIVLTELGEATTDRLRKFFEITTVTKKLRRIAELDEDTLAFTMKVNRPDVVFMNHFQYLFPKESGKKEWAELSTEAVHWIKDFNLKWGVPIRWVSTGPQTVIRIPNLNVC